MEVMIDGICNRNVLINSVHAEYDYGTAIYYIEYEMRKGDLILRIGRQAWIKRKKKRLAQKEKQEKRRKKTYKLLLVRHQPNRCQR